MQQQRIHFEPGVSTTNIIFMGITASLEQITPEQLVSFQRNPKSAYDHILSDFWDNPNAEEFLSTLDRKFSTDNLGPNIPPEMRAAVAAKAKHIAAELRSLGGPQIVKKKVERKQFSLEKDWHVLHYVLNGTTEGGDGPLADVILGGTEIPDNEGVMSFGPLRYLTPDQVQAASAALANIDPKVLTTRLDQKDAEAKQIYLAHTLGDPDDWSYLPQLFEEFRNFYSEAAEHGSAMLLHLS